MGMLYAAIDIHKHVLQSVTLTRRLARLCSRSRRRHAKTDKLDARWLAMLLAKEMLPPSWLPPEDIQRLRDLTRLRQSVRHDRTRWAQRLHAILLHEGWPCSRSEL